MKQSRFIKAVYNEKRLAVIFAVLFALSLLPLLALAFYNHPGVDDFGYGIRTRAAYLATHNIAAVLAAAGATVAETYRDWQGTYASVFLFAVNPAVFGEALYPVTTFIMLSMLIGSTVFLLQTLIVGVLGSDRKYVALAAVPVLYFSIEALPFPVEGLYWYNGSVHYTFCYSLMLFLLGLCISLYQAAPPPGGKEPRPYWLKAVLAALLCPAIGGGNLVTGLVAALFLAGLVAACFACRRPLRAKITITVLFMLLLAAFFVNVLAPGNAIRAVEEGYGGFGGPYQAVMAILMSLYAAGYNIALWLDLRLLALLIFLAPVFWRLTGDTAYAFKRPWLAVLASYLLYAAGFAPALYATGNMGRGRVRNILFCTLVLLVFINYVYLLGWLRRRLEARPPAGGKAALARFSLVAPYASAAFALVFLLASAYHLKGHTSYTAAAHLLDGSARQYSREMKGWYEILHDENIKQAYLPPLTNPPVLLYWNNILPDKDHYENQELARFYQKEYVVAEQSP
ncbi:MAG: hypothetical protein LBI54_03435 [Lachnospiraceae bacterium]|jgi:hypothetical protein|nr:hypothetical protein [Lachnospiraceae bacterium]